MNPEAYKEIPNRRLFFEKLIQSCELCPRMCGVNRLEGEKGFCGLDARAYCFREILHPNEEKELSPSHQIYFSGCNLRCEYCSVAEWNELPCEIDAIELDNLVKRIRERQAQGAMNLNFLGGEPSVNVYGILDFLERIDHSTTIVWNSNMYYDGVVDEGLRGLADIFLADIKCGNTECSEKNLSAADYFSVACNMVSRAIEHADVIVRHLVLPGHLDCCCRPILEWLVKELPEVKISLRFNYIPPPEANYSPKGYLSQEEKDYVLEMASRMNLNLIE